MSTERDNWNNANGSIIGTLAVTAVGAIIGIIAKKRTGKKSDEDVVLKAGKYKITKSKDK